MNSTLNRRRMLLPICARLMAMFLLGRQALAATRTVTVTNDGGPGSLRQAVADALSGDIITFAVSNTITLSSDELLLAKNLSLLGPGASTLALSGAHTNRVLEIGPNSIVA